MARKLMKGNEAMATAAITAGCKCFFGYPITPQNEIPEFMSKAMYESGGAFVQAASVRGTEPGPDPGLFYGGKRSSGSGFSLSHPDQGTENKGGERTGAQRDDPQSKGAQYRSENIGSGAFRYGWTAASDGREAEAGRAQTTAYFY